MRTCDEILEWLSAALDGQLTGEEQTELDGHLAHCPACSALFAELNTLHTATAQLEEVPAPADLKQKIMDRIAADPAQENSDNVIPFSKKKNTRRAWKTWGACAAAVAIVSLGAISLPGRFGANKADNFDATEALVADASMAQDEAYSYSAENQSTAFYDMATADVVQDAVDAQAPCPSAEIAPEQSEEVSYWTTYVLTCDAIPPELEGYESFVDQEGNRTYLLPVDELCALVESWKEENADLTDTGRVDPSAQYGRIIVKLP